MSQTIEFAEYTPDTGLCLSWDPGTSITITQDGNEILVKGNRPGLVTLARHLLTLAQPGVPQGAHMHLDEFNGLEPGSTELIIELVEEERLRGLIGSGVGTPAFPRRSGPRPKAGT
jgi:hypothetical protein